MPLDGYFDDELRKELYESDGIAWFKEDPIYAHLADGFPNVLKELALRDLDYLVITEFALNAIRRQQKDGKNKTKDVKKWISTFIDSMAQKSPALEDELNRAYMKGKSKRKIISEAFADLERTRDKGMKGKTQKYLPLIERADGYVCITPFAEELFNPLIIKKYGSEWLQLSKAERIEIRREMDLPYIEEP